MSKIVHHWSSNSAIPPIVQVSRNFKFALCKASMNYLALDFDGNKLFCIKMRVGWMQFCFQNLDTPLCGRRLFKNVRKESIWLLVQCWSIYQFLRMRKDQVSSLSHFPQTSGIFSAVILNHGIRGHYQNKIQIYFSLEVPANLSFRNGAIYHVLGFLVYISLILCWISSF